jgi:hypothetical protein
MKDELDDVTDTMIDIDPVCSRLSLTRIETTHCLCASRETHVCLVFQERLSYFRLARYTDDTRAAANKMATSSK